jgi:adenylate kinase family enzyme
VRRVAVVGNSGSGKSTLARALAAQLAVPWVELDAINHLPGWTERPAEEMIAEVDRRCPPDGAWVVDGNYAAKGGELARARADTIVWLDLPRPTVMRRLGMRTLRRGLMREELWSGNRESLRRAASRDPERSILAWAWTRHAVHRAQFAAEADARWVRLTSPRAVADWVEAVR